MRSLALIATMLAAFASAAAQGTRAWAPYTEVADFYERFDEASEARRADIDFRMRVVPSDETTLGELLFTMAPDVAFGTDASGHLDFPRSDALLTNDPIIFVNQPAATLLWLTPVAYYEGTSDGEATGEELRDFAKRFGKIVRSNAGAFAMFMPSPKGVRVRGAPGGTVTLEDEGAAEVLQLDKDGLLVLARKRLKSAERVRFTPGQTVEAYYEKSAFFLTDIDAANR